MFRWSVDCLRKNSRGAEDEKQGIIGICLAAQGLCSLAHSLEQAKHLADESIAIMRSLPPRKEIGLPLLLLKELATDETERRQLTQESIDTAKAVESGSWLPKSMMDLGYLAIKDGEYAKAKALVQEARAVYRGIGNPALEVQALHMLGKIAQLQGDYVEARRLLQESLAIAQDTGYSAGVWWSNSNIAGTALLQADYTAAQAHYQAGLAVCQEMGDRQELALALNGLGSAACGVGNYEEARLYFNQALQLARTFDDRLLILYVMGGIAWLLAGTNQPEFAVRLAAYVLSQLDNTEIGLARSAQLLKTLEALLSVETFALATEQGKNINFDETVRILRAKLSQPLENEPVSNPYAVDQLLSDALTERELDVLRYIADGLSNYDIAVRLFVGVSTVKTHINHIFSKLCVKNRTQAVARARDLHLL